MKLITLSKQRTLILRFLVVLTLLATVMIINFANAATPQASSKDKTTIIRVSKKSDRSKDSQLHGQTLSGDAYIFVKPNSVKKVYFYLDPTSTSYDLKNPTTLQTTAPFDLMHTAKDGSANKLDTTTLKNGDHILVTLVYWNDGYVSVPKVVPFKVANTTSTSSSSTSTTTTTTTTTTKPVTPPTIKPTTTTTTTTTAKPVTPPTNASSVDFHTCYPNAFCKPNGEVVVMNGFNLRDIGSTNIDKYASLKQFQKIKAKGFNVVRPAMQWENFQPNKGTNGFNETSFSDLHKLVNNAKQAGIYVILDPIHGTGRGNCSGTDGHIPAWAQVTTNGVCQQRIGAVNANSTDYIQRVAREFANEPTVVAIDLANEIQSINYTDDAQLLGMYNKLINDVRTVDNDKILVIEPQSGGRLLKADNIAKYIDNKSNILYSSHDYFGGAYDANGNLGKDCLLSGYNSSNSQCSGRLVVDAGGTGYLNPAKNKASLREHIKVQLDMLSDPRVRMPLYIGEYNAYDNLPGADQWRKDTVAIFKEFNLSRTQWLFFNAGYSYQDSLEGSHSATKWTSPTDNTPGDWKYWVDDLL